jgi:SARP family transcriptional regulator, regulator of embCAB operon
MSSEPEKIRIRLLGPLTADLNARPVTPSAAKQRQILALLAFHAGRVVTAPMLVEELWGDYPPRSSATTLQTYILQLRNKIAAAAPGKSRAMQLLSTRHGGYLLDEAGCEIDVEDFSRLALAGRAAAESGDHRTASERLTQALQLWRGPALVDVPTGRILELEATSLEETRLGVLERRIEADLALRRHVDLIGELTMLAARNLMNENFCALLMIALYRSGYAGRSLEAYQRLRNVLREELGVEPCMRLRRLQQAVLSRSPALEAGELEVAASMGTDALIR